MTGRFLRWGIDAARVILNREALIKRKSSPYPVSSATSRTASVCEQRIVAGIRTSGNVTAPGRAIAA